MNKTFPLRDNGRDIRSLEGIVVGDVFMRMSAGYDAYYEKAVCTRITPKSAEINGKDLYRISDNTLKGRQPYFRHAGSLEVYDENVVKAANYKRNLKFIRSKISVINWNAIKDDVVLEIYKLVEDATCIK